MARYVATVPSTRSADDAFAYVADFRSVAEWDPSVQRAALTTDGAPIRVGAGFRVSVAMLGRTTSLDYEIVELVPGTRVVLRGESRTFVSTDTVTVVPRGTGSELTYDADLALKGVLRLADPVLGFAFGRLGQAAEAGLLEHLNPVVAG